MGSRSGLHQLSNGLYVSGRPEQLKERQATVALRAVPYTGGDVKNSGELGKMYGIDFSSGDHSSPPVPRLSSRASSSSQHTSGSVRSGPNSGPFPKKSPSSSFSGPIMTPIQPTGLLTSGPLSSSSVGRRSGPLEPTASFSKPVVYGSAVTSLSEEVKLRFRVSRLAMWVVLLLLLMTLVVGAFLMVAVKKAVILLAAAGILAPLFVFLLWNFAYKQRGFMGFLKRFPDSELRGAIDGHYVKVTGVATCGSIPLETSFQKIERCIYVSTELYEYRGWGGKPANPRHCFFSWGQRHSEKYVADFYISDFQSGLRALVKTGYGAKVAPFVTPSTVVDITKNNRELSPNFLKWLADRKLSSDDRIIRLKEGYIQEGSTVSVMGVVRRHDNVLMIVPPEEPVSTGVQWTRCLLPTNIEGLVLTSDDCQNADVIPV
ncbi:PREDICTED: uncharacterized membrane protein At1g16860 isoform X3 [Ipomoea nil]|uniref:uncharacterized membrane protein At1g16860 isoform X2 n=1 Tax=Ipomoea nil TaxID=35883 RepID=UPI000900DA79|nr:PREDICTED: uncharacterized membrane protein At1g16860 isoform X2 [Ipomoea nil]XP_019171473.1 PREDICTED: uncharacterized membrane protein At1g16860 isoform X3 [Ipomoea nil]